MSRKELAIECYKIMFRDGITIGWNDYEVWRSIAQTDDETLLRFYEEHKEI